MNFIREILGLIRNGLESWGDYSRPEQIAYYIAGLGNSACLKKYKEIERGLSKKVEEQIKYLLNTPSKNIIDGLDKEGFAVKMNPLKTYTDYYYDTDRCELSKENYIIRVREKQDGTYEGTFKELIASNNPQALHNVATVNLQACDVAELIRKLQNDKGISNPLFSKINTYPKFKIEIDRTSYELALEQQYTRLFLDADKCVITDIQGETDAPLKVFDKIEAKDWGRKPAQILRKVATELGNVETKKTNCQIGFDCLEKKKEKKEMERED